MKRRQFLLTSAATVVAGCSESQSEPTESMFAGAFDASSSFLDRSENAFRHFSASKDAFFRSAVGSESRMMITQISGSTDAILFDGSPITFSRQFPTAPHFKDWLATKATSASSRVYLSLAETVEWLCKQHDRSSGMTSTLLVYSDMVDNHGGKERLLAALKRYSQYSVSVWLYWVSNVDEWEAILNESNIPHRVEPHFRADPPIPQF